MKKSTEIVNGHLNFEFLSSQEFTSAVPSSSHSFPAPPWDLFHEMQSFKNCSSVGPSHGLFFKNVSSMGPTCRVLSTRNRLLQRGLFFMDHSSWQDAAPVLALHGLQLPSGHIHLLWHGVLHRLQGNSVVVSMVLCSSAWNISSPSFFTYIGACRVFFLVFSFLSLTAAAEHFYPLLSML